MDTDTNKRIKKVRQRRRASKKRHMFLLVLSLAALLLGLGLLSGSFIMALPRIRLYGLLYLLFGLGVLTVHQLGETSRRTSSRS